MLFSIITVNFNDDVGLERTLKSIKKVKIECVESIVIDGNSSDGSAKIITNSKVIDKYVIESDSGIYDAMNKGIKFANGKWIIFMNSGDEFAFDFDFKSFLSEVECLPSENVIIYGDPIRKVGDILYYEKSVKIDVKEKCKYIPCHQTMFLPASFLKNNLFDLKYQIVADVNQILECLKQVNSVYYYQKPVCIFHVGGVSSTASKSFKVFLLRYNERCLAYKLNKKDSLSLFLKMLQKEFLLKVFGFTFYYSIRYSIKNILRNHREN